MTMLITKTVYEGFGGRLAFAASLYVMLVLLDRDWGEGVEADPPPDKNFQSPVWGSSSTSGGG